jgi:2'-5' RNA ligase
MQPIAKKTSPEGNKFTPHLTLARLRSPSNINAIMEKAARIAAIESVVARETISSLELMSRVLSPKGPTYSVMGRVLLST